MSARTSTCALICAVLGACSPSTALLLEIDPGDVPETEQLRVVGRSGDALLFGPAIRPDIARGPLQGTQTLRVLLPAETEGTASVSVEGLVAGKVRGARSVEVELQPDSEVRIPVRLMLAQPACGECEGCCEGDKCVGGSLAACGAGGAACLACDAVAADQCSNEGRCACGAGSSCAPERGSDRCVGGQCRCGTGNPCEPGLRCDNGVCRCTPESCAGCCIDNACFPGNQDTACGAAGALCSGCAVGTRCASGHCMAR